MKIPQSLIEKRLFSWPVARLATFNGSDQIHQVPIVFTWHGGKLWSPIDGKPKRGTELTRVKNALARASGSILLDEYSDDWSQLWWLRIDVAIKVIYLKEASQAIKTEAEHAIAALENKYPQYQNTAVLTHPPTLLCMTPSACNSWQAS